MINGFELANEDKLTRAKDKVGEGASDEQILAEYDRLGGLITRNGDKLKTGSFYDFKAKKPLKEPKLVFIYSVNGKFVEVEDGEALPGEVRAVKATAKAKKVVVEESEETEETEVKPKSKGKK